MADLKIWSESQVQQVFDELGLKDQDSKDQPTTKPQFQREPLSTSRIILPRLSNSSVPPPTGTTPYADLERNPRRS